MNDIEIRNAWLKDLMGKELSAEERTAMTATATIPTVTMNKVMAALEENELLKHVDLTRVKGYLTIPAESSAAAASWSATSTDSEDVVGPCSLNAYQLIKTVEVPAGVNAMSVDAFEEYLIKRLVNKIEVALQTAVIAGSGSAQATGIVTTVSTATGTFTKAGVTKGDLLKIMGSLPTEYHNGAVWIMPASVFYGEVMNITNSVDFASVNAGFGRTLFGHPVVLDGAAKVSNTDNILFGDAKRYHLNLAEDIRVDKDLSVGFRSNSAVYRAVCLADGKLDNAAAFVRYTRSAS